jgi:hemerythrin-like metal-binding protein
VIYAALVEALRYTETHLREEEAYMRAQDYPFIDDHCDQHAVAAEEMHKFTLGEYDEDYLISYFSNFLPNWLQYHINTSDRRMAEWVLQNTQIPPQE